MNNGMGGTQQNLQLTITQGSTTISKTFTPPSGQVSAGLIEIPLISTPITFTFDGRGWTYGSPCAAYLAFQP